MKTFFTACHFAVGMISTTPNLVKILTFGDGANSYFTEHSKYKNEEIKYT